MRFDYTDEQHEIRQIAVDILASRCTLEDVRQAAEARTYDETLWKEIAELGWLGIGISEKHGGQGLGMVGVSILLEAMGYAVAPVPALGATMAATILETAGSAEQRAEWLPRLAQGDVRAALVLPEGPCPDVVGADLFMVVDELGYGELVLATDADVQEFDTIDETRRYGSVAGVGTPLPGDVRAGLKRACVAVAAELVGVCQRALDMTVAHVKDRKQFGTAVGAFQAVSHRCVEMLLMTESARSTTLFAAWACDSDPAHAADAAAVAKAVASDAGRDVPGAAIQAHGGVGFTWEGGLHWLYKRGQLDAVVLGGASTHRARIAETLFGRSMPTPAR